MVALEQLREGGTDSRFGKRPSNDCVRCDFSSAWQKAKLTPLPEKESLDSQEYPGDSPSYSLSREARGTVENRQPMSMPLEGRLL